jgi:hypothetical protein
MAEDTPAHERTDLQRQATDREALLRVARHRFRAAEEAQATWREQAREDYAFLAGQQWPDAVEAQRTADGRPCLTINQLPQFVRQVVNEERQNRPAITVQPVDDQADVETAEVIEGLLRQIQNASNADIAYDTAIESVTACGIGYIRVQTKYVGPDSFDQEPCIERILNPLTVYLDPTSTDPTGADANWAFCVQVLAKDVYEAQYGRLPPESSSWETTGDAWITPETVRIAEYYWREWRPVRLALLQDGTVHPFDQLPDDAPVVQTRTAQVPTVYWAKLIGYQVLEQTRWLGTSIPLVKVTGEERLTDEGQLDYTGVVRHAKDPQYAYNLWASAEAEAIALAPKSPWVMAEGQQEGYEHLWATANTRNHAFLPYKPMTIGGVAAPPPQRQSLEPPVQAIAQARVLASQDLQSTTGIYAPQLGQQGPPGEAAATVLQQRQQGQMGNFHYLDNLRRSVRRVGQILVELLPKLYDGRRVLRILGADDSLKQVVLNETYIDPQTGKPVLYDLSTGRYDVVVSAGPGYATKRQEAVGVLMNLTQALPQAMQFAVDILVKNLDMPGGKALEERLHKLLPPELQEGKEGQPSEAQQLQQLGQQVQQMTQQLEALNAYAQQAEQAIQQLTQDNKLLQLRMADKEQENVLTAQANEIKLQEAQIKAQESAWNHEEALLKLEIDARKASLLANGQEG